MGTIIDFIKNFHVASYGLTMVDVWVCLGLILIVSVLVRWLISFLPQESSAKVKRIITVVSLSFIYSIVAFIILNALLNKRYDKMILLIFFLVVPYVKKMYQLYDNLVDKWMRNTNAEK
jgi:hypothetical protein